MAAIQETALRPDGLAAGLTDGAAQTAAPAARDFPYSPVLDGWRAISIMMVIVSHAGLDHIIPGGLGVTIFFFISGFLITSLLLLEFRKSGRISLANFYLRRFWRLSPPLFVYIALSTLLCLRYATHFNYLEPLSAVLYFANYYSLYWHYEFLPFGPSPFRILWSLAIEEHYYIFFAPLAALLAHSRRRMVILLMLLIAVPLLIRLWVVIDGQSRLLEIGYTYTSTETRIDSIAWGALFALLCRSGAAARLKPLLDNWAAIGLSVAVMLLCLLIRDNNFRESLRYTLQGLALIPLFYVTLYGETWRGLKKMLGSRPAVLIGRLSYSIYLYHWLALTITDGLIGGSRLTAAWLACFYALTAVLSIASYRLIEQPSLSLRKRFGSHAVA